VPALTLDNGEVLTENVAVLQYIADRNPAASRASRGHDGALSPDGMAELHQLGTSQGFSPLFRQDAPEDTKQYARNHLTTRLDYLQRAFAARPS